MRFNASLLIPVLIVFIVIAIANKYYPQESLHIQIIIGIVSGVVSGAIIVFITPYIERFHKRTTKRKSK